MIQPKELRIGNYVYLIAEGHETQSDLFQWDIEDYEFYSKRMNDIIPIPLTEEWLLKFGFISNYISYKLENNNYLIELYFYDCWNLNYIEKEKFGNGNVELKGYWNVHQLQNLYFALTGEELQFK